MVASAAGSALARDRERFFEALNRDAQLGSTTEGQRLTRFFAATWLCSIHGPFQLTLPEALRRAWPLEAGSVTLVGLSDTFEIWTPQNWIADVARTSADYESLLESISDPSDE